MNPEHQTAPKIAESALSFKDSNKAVLHMKFKEISAGSYSLTPLAAL